MKLNVQLFFKSIFQLKQSNKAQVFDIRMKIYCSMKKKSECKEKKMKQKLPQNIDIRKTNVTYIKSILYTIVTTHVTIITNELIKKPPSNQIYDNWKM